jgi:hypothetical protein
MVYIYTNMPLCVNKLCILAATIPSLCIPSPDMEQAGHICIQPMCLYSLLLGTFRIQEQTAFHVYYRWTFFVSVWELVYISSSCAPLIPVLPALLSMLAGWNGQGE